MKWCRFRRPDGVAYGVLEGDMVLEVDGSPFDLGWRRSGRQHRIDNIELEVPAIPRNFFAMGLNYASHIAWAAKTMGLPAAIPTQAHMGYRSNNALLAHGGIVIIPHDSPGPIHYESELVAVIGKRTRNVSETEALRCVLGYTLGNDISDRTWQTTDRTLWRAKNCDTFKPMGPVIETELNPSSVVITTRINGATVSSYEAGKMIFGVAHCISRLSRYATLYPGDVIWFGTDGATEPPLLGGEEVEIECREIGVLSSRIVRAASTET